MLLEACKLLIHMLKELGPNVSVQLSTTGDDKTIRIRAIWWDDSKAQDDIVNTKYISIMDVEMSNIDILPEIIENFKKERDLYIAERSKKND